MVVVAVHHHIEFGIGRDAGEREVAGADDRNSQLVARHRSASGIEHGAIVEDVCLGVQSAAGVDAHFQLARLDQSHQRSDQPLGPVGLVEQRCGLTDGLSRDGCGTLASCEVWEGQRLGGIGDLF